MGLENSTPIAHLNFRKKALPSTEEIDKEMRRLLKYDEENGGFIWIASRTPNQRRIIVGKAAGGSDGRGYKSLLLFGHKFKVHRLVWLWHHGFLPETMLDHKNGSRSDNRIDNLRQSAAVENIRNSVKKSGQMALGVLKTPIGRFNARIQIPGGKKVYLGTFDTEAEAAAAYVGAATILHGEFSILKRIG